MNDNVSNNDNILVLDNISYRFDTAETPIFNDLNLTVAKNEVVSIVGASGVGKTTLFNIAAGLLVPETGQVCINGVETTAQAGKVGYMLQKDLLLPFKTVYENICLPLTLKGQPQKQIDDVVKPQLARFGLEGLEGNYPHNLSGGQRQRAALLRTYLTNHPIMLLDEPFSALDFVTKDEMYHWFKKLRERLGLTCLIITHDIDEALFLSNQLYVLKGKPAHFTEQFYIPQSSDFANSQAYLELKNRILNAIKN